MRTVRGFLGRDVENFIAASADRVHSPASNTTVIFIFFFFLFFSDVVGSFGALQFNAASLPTEGDNIG